MQSRDREDSLGVSKGILLALVIGCLLWIAMIGAVVYMLRAG